MDNDQKREYMRNYRADPQRRAAERARGRLRFWKNRDILLERQRQQRRERGCMERGSPELHAHLVRAGKKTGELRTAQAKIRHAGHRIVNGHCRTCWAATRIVGVLKHRARARNTTCTLIRPDIEELLSHTGQPCPLCDTIMTPWGNSTGHHRRTVVSIDRLDNSRGYDPDNVWVICHWCNIRKRDVTLPWLRRLVYELEHHRMLTLTKAS